jgi:hypothetical protein
MRKYVNFAAGMVLVATALQAQTLQVQAERRVNTAFQFFGDAPQGAIGIKMLGLEGMGGQVVTGKPLSAIEERQTLQVLGDGTRIDNTQKNNFYRDSEGRTRIERPNGAVILHDPVAGVMLELNPANKTVRTVFKTAGPGKDLDRAKEKLAAEMSVHGGTIAVAGGPMAGSVQTKEGMFYSVIGPPGGDKLSAERSAKETAASNRENLGIQSVNGVTAQGSRTTITIPAGQIGNDRPMQIVSEQWFSSDLQMLVKSTNSDPRFGETSYQLTNINQAAPDPSLFQIPADYTTPQGK